MFTDIDIHKLLSLLKYSPETSFTFTSGVFLFLFCIFMFFYSIIKNRMTPRIVYTTLFSLYFYYLTSGFYFLLLILVSIFDFSFGFFIYNSKNNNLVRKTLVTISVIFNLSLLGYFKYTNFFLGLFADVTDTTPIQTNIFLPIGVSFFTFQSISYTVDVYRKRIKPVQLWIDYLFYVSFFPQLVAGPIVRARDFIPQIYHKAIVVTKEMFERGYFLILTGLFKKCIISDYIAANFVDEVFTKPELYSGIENLMAVYGYALQIYCDFSGYSDIAIGIALLLGFKFNLNFDSPYKSATLTEFWRRWHISLSTWLKDYLYISLGGNRRNKLKTYRNLMITMLLGGLWHGASLKFVIWGGLHGLALALHKFLIENFKIFKKQGKDMKSKVHRFFSIFLTFNFVCFTWIFFRANSMNEAKIVISKIFTQLDLSLLTTVLENRKWVFSIMVLGYFLHFVPNSWDVMAHKLSSKTNIIIKALFMAILIWFIMQIKTAETQPFIYFQF